MRKACMSSSTKRAAVVFARSPCLRAVPTAPPPSPSVPFPPPPSPHPSPRPSVGPRVGGALGSALAGGQTGGAAQADGQELRRPPRPDRGPTQLARTLPDATGAAQGVAATGLMPELAAWWERRRARKAALEHGSGGPAAPPPQPASGALGARASAPSSGSASTPAFSPASPQAGVWVGGRPLHSSHTLRFAPALGLWYCSVCGLYAALAARDLAAKCSGRRTQRGEDNLVAISKGEWPHAKGMPRAVQELLTHTQQAALPP